MIIDFEDGVSAVYTADFLYQALSQVERIDLEENEPLGPVDSRLG